MSDDLFSDVDLGAARQARAEKRGGVTGFRVRIDSDHAYTLPVELPGSVLAPLLRRDAGLVDVLGELLKFANEDGGDATDMDTLIALLTERPALPHDLLDAVREAAEELFGGPEPWAEVMAAGLSVADWGHLASRLLRAYRVTLGEAFGSSAPSGDGTTSTQTSASSTGSKRPGSGRTRGRRVS